MIINTNCWAMATDEYFEKFTVRVSFNLNFNGENLKIQPWVCSQSKNPYFCGPSCFPKLLANASVQPGQDFDGDVAQLVEQRTENPCVGGSIPSVTTTKNLPICGGSLNNKHWISDVLVGAEIGVLSTNLVYLTHQYRWGKNRKKYQR